jgi:ABC-type transport system substrate-binding protein
MRPVTPTRRMTLSMPGRQRTLDQEERIAIVHQMQQIVFDDIVYIIPYSPLAVQAYRSDRFSWLVDQ